MLLKLIGSILVISSSTIIGYSVSGKFRRRPLELQTLQAAMQMLEAEIIFSVSPLPEAFKKICLNFPGSIGNIFKLSSEKLLERKGLTAKEAWYRAIEGCKAYTCLDDEDIKILKDFGSMLGCTDKENQVNNIRLIISKLSIAEKKAEIKKDKNEKMYKYLGVLFGCMIVLLLI